MIYINFEVAFERPDFLFQFLESHLVYFVSGLHCKILERSNICKGTYNSILLILIRYSKCSKKRTCLAYRQGFVEFFSKCFQRVGNAFSIILILDLK